MKQEFMKNYLRKKSLIMIALFLLIKIFSFIAEPSREDFIIAQDKLLYMEYLNEFGGKLTDEKVYKIISEFDAINAAKKEMDDVRNQFLKGEIKSTEFSSNIARLKKTTSKENVFLKIFEQYEYAMQNAERREIIYTAGWEKLLDNESPDLILVLFLVLILSCCFSSEYECSMDKLLLTSKNGRTKLCAAKLFSSLILAFIASFIFILLDIYDAVRLGISDFSAPLESIPLFYNTSYHISLLSALLLTSGLKLYGYMFFSAIILLISAKTKKTLPTMCASFGFILLQYAGLDNSDFKYRFALPYGFMLGCGYLKGESENGNLQFSPISLGELSAILVISMIIFVILCVVILFSFNIKRKSRIKLIYIIGLSMLLCSCNSQSDDEQIFILNNSEWTEGNGYIFSYTGKGQMISKTTGEITDFIRNPFYDIETDSDKAPISAPIYAVGNKAYYLSDSVYSTIIKERNLDDMSEKIIYQTKGEERKYFLGLGHRYANTHNYIITGFFLNDNYIFFVTDGGIIEINRISGKAEKIIFDVENGSVIFDGMNIYYVSSDYSFMKFDIESRTTEKVIDDKMSSCLIVDDIVYYVNLNDGSKPYMCRLGDTQGTKISDLPAKSLSTDGESIYFISTDDVFGKVYRTSLKTLETEIFFDENAYFVYVFSDYDNAIIFVRNDNTEMISLFVDKNNPDDKIPISFYSK